MATVTPIYMQILPNDIVLHFTENHGDCNPGVRAYIHRFKGLKDYPKPFLDTQYGVDRAGPGKMPWNPITL